jgi:hypothetical protein
MYIHGIYHIYTGSWYIHGIYMVYTWYTPCIIFQRVPDGGAAAARRLHWAKQHSGYIGREKSVYNAFRLIFCQPRLWTRPGGLGEIQAVTTHRPNSSSWVGGRPGRALIVKVMVGGGRRGILAPAELGPGEMNTCMNEGVGSG